jgi:hypothetical protein
MKYKITIVKDIAEEIEVDAFDIEHAQHIAIDRIKKDKEYEKIVAYWVEDIKEEEKDG